MNWTASQKRSNVMDTVADQDSIADQVSEIVAVFLWLD